MHGSLNILAQCVSRISLRSSLQSDDRSMSSNDASRQPLPPTVSSGPRIRNCTPVVSLPVPGTFARSCESDIHSEDIQPSHSLRPKRWPTEMPLSSHPPFRPSWLEAQPSRTHTSRQKVNLRAEVAHSHPKNDLARKQSPEATTSLPYHGIKLPPPPPIPNTRQRRKKSHRKPSVAVFEDTTPINLFEQPIAPLTPRRRQDNTLYPVTSLHPSGAGPKILHSAAANSSSQRCVGSRHALRDSQVNSRSSHNIPPDDSFQLKLFSELDVELEEAMSLYTAGERPLSKY